MAAGTGHEMPSLSLKVAAAATIDATTVMSPSCYWAVTIAIMSCSLIQFLDMTIANVAIPHMQAALDASRDSVTWVLTSFIVASAVAIPAAGWIAARFGSRRPFLLTVGAFVASSMLCGVAGNLVQMVTFRILQGISAAFIGPLAQAIVLDITPQSKHARAMSVWGMTAMLGPIAGPTLGGYLTDNLNWRWVFFINAPIGIPALIVLLNWLPDTPRRPRKLDLKGYVLLAIALAALQLMLDRGSQNDWFDSRETWVELLVAISCFWMFAVHSVFQTHPLFPSALLTPRVLLSMLLSCAMGLIMMGVAAMLPGMYQTLFGYSVMQTGELMAPRGIGTLVIMALIPRIMDHVPLRLILSAGFALVAISTYQMTSWTLVMPESSFTISAFVQGLGLGMLMVPINLIAFPLSTRR